MNKLKNCAKMITSRSIRRVRPYFRAKGHVEGVRREEVAAYCRELTIVRCTAHYLLTPSFHEAPHNWEESGCMASDA